MAKEKVEKKRRRRRAEVEEPSPAPGVPPKSKAQDRRGLWVVNSGRMKQYGDYKIERPGQVIRQQYLKNDELLLKHNYVKPLEDNQETTQCKACGLVFLGNVISGAYKIHLEQARHDLEQSDLDAGIKRRAPKTARVGDETNPDADNKGEWDLEEEGAPPPTKLEQESPGGVRLKIGQ